MIKEELDCCKKIIEHLGKAIFKEMYASQALKLTKDLEQFVKIHNKYSDLLTMKPVENISMIQSIKSKKTK